MLTINLKFTHCFRIFILCLLSFSSNFSQAQSFNGSFQVSAEEVAIHRWELKRFADVAVACMERDYERHLSFYEEYGISAFYGDNSYFYRLSTEGKKAFLRSIGKDPALLSQMERTSCVGFAIKCFKQGFDATGQAALWLKINRYMSQNNYDGSALIDALRALGWYVMYWNPDPSQNAQWDAEEKASTPVNDGSWGYHAYRYATATRQNKYYKNFIDDAETLVGFGTQTPDVLSRAPIFVGVAHAGYHVFPGFRGYVIEAHSTRDIRDYYTIEAAHFNPLKFEGAPRGLYRSGLVAVPPGSEP